MIDKQTISVLLYDFATSGRLSSDYNPHDSVDDIIKFLPKPSKKCNNMLSEQYDYGKRPSIPKHWRWIRLGEISSYGETPIKVSCHDVNPNTWILDLEDIQSGGTVWVKSLVCDKQFKGERIVFKKGQVLYSKLRPYLKKCLVALDDGICTPEIIAFDVFCGILPQYIVYCLLNSFTNRAIDKRSYGVKMPRVDANYMVNLPIPVPPLSEQMYIVKRIQEIFLIFNTIDRLQKQYSNNRAVLKRKLIEAAIQGKLTEQLPEDGTAEELFAQIQAEKHALIKAKKIKKEKPLPPINKDGIPFEIPRNWKWVYGKHILKPMETKRPTGEVFNYIDIDSIDNKHQIVSKTKQVNTKEAPSRACRALHTGDTIFSMVRPYLKNIAYIDNSIANSIASSGFYVCTPIDIVDSRYNYYMMVSHYVIDGLNDFMKGDNSPSIRQEDLEQFKFPLPPLAEQKRIVAKLDELLSIIDG